MAALEHIMNASQLSSSPSNVSVRIHAGIDGILACIGGGMYFNKKCSPLRQSKGPAGQQDLSQLDQRRAAMSPDERIKALTEILRILAWPAVVAWLIWFLREEMKRVAVRITEIGFTGAKFAPPEQIASPPSNVVSEAVSGQPSSPKEGEGQPAQQNIQLLIARMKAFISEEQLDPAQRQLRTELPTVVGPHQADQLELLIWGSASLNIQLNHERNYNVIYGSQIQLLMQASTGWGLLPSTVKGIYDVAHASYPGLYSSYTFEQWIGFLLTSNLCSIAQDGNYIATPFGRGFIKYVALDKRYPLNKPF